MDMARKSMRVLLEMALIYAMLWSPAPTWAARLPAVQRCPVSGASVSAVTCELPAHTSIHSEMCVTEGVEVLVLRGTSTRESHGCRDRAEWPLSRERSASEVFPGADTAALHLRL